MRCPRCGNENSETNRFCGMCGGPLRQAPPAKPAEEPAAKVSQASSGGSAPNPPAARATAASVAPPPSTRADEGPVISGPSFLGLNQPPPAPTGKRSSLSIDPHSSSRNLDYLLEDDEPSHGRGWKFLFMLLALALAVGFGYLRWKNGGFAWLDTVGSKPSAQVAQAPDTNSSSNTNAEAPLAPGAITPVATSPTPMPAAPAPSAAKDPNTPAASTSVATAPAASTPTPAATDNSAPATAPAANSPAPTPTDNSAANTAPPSTAETQPAKNKDAAADDDDSTDTTEKPEPAPARKPSPTVSRTASDPVAEAQRYIYGKGVSQDCDRGLRLLKPAANASNSKAMIEMGALYSAGLCTPRDLPTAYRWFALALRKEPDNQSVQTDLQKLWGEMTQPERQLAIRLSQ